MADVAAAPSAAPAAAAPSAAPAPVPVGEAALAKLPDKLQNLTRPVVVSGTVTGETAEGLTRVRTAAGEVLLKSPVPLATDKPVTLQIPAGSPPARAMVLATALATATAPPPAAAGQAAAPPQIGAGQTLLQSIASAAASAVAAQPAQMLTAGSLLSAVVLAANPRPASPPGAAPTTAQTSPAPGGKPAAAPTGEDGGKDGAATAGAKPAAAAPAAAPLSRSGTQGQPVTLGGDAAHRGSQVAPPPQTTQPAAPQQSAAPQPAQAQTSAQSPAQQPAQQQPATPQPPPPQQPPNGEAPPQQQQTARQHPAPRPPQPTVQPAMQPTASPQTAANTAAATPQTAPSQTATPQTAPPQTPATQTAPAAPPRGPTVGLSGPSFAAAPPAPASTSSTPNQAPSTTPTAAAPDEPVNTPATAPSSPTTPPVAPEAAPPPVLRAGQTLALKIVAITPPGDTPAPAAAAPVADANGGPLLEGEAAGTTPQGKPIVALRDGMLALNTDRALPPGSRLTLQIADPAALAGGGLAAPVAEDLPDYLQTRDWPALKQALGALRDIDPALVHNFLAAAMPQPNRKLGAALTFLISAMRGGDARGWLGADATNALRDNGKESLLRGLEREFQAKEQQTAEKLPDEWRGVTLPFYDQTGLQPLHLHVRPFPDDDETAADKGGGPKGSRFVLDVELSRLGPLQLDGMVKPPRFDLILRSNAPLDAGLRQELRDIFARCLDAVGYGGGVSFQADTRGWVRLSRAGSSAPAVTA